MCMNCVIKKYEERLLNITVLGLCTGLFMFAVGLVLGSWFQRAHRDSQADEPGSVWAMLPSVRNELLNEEIAELAEFHARGLHLPAFNPDTDACLAAYADANDMHIVAGEDGAVVLVANKLPPVTWSVTPRKVIVIEEPRIEAPRIEAPQIEPPLRIR